MYFSVKIPLDKVSSSYSQEWEPIHRKNLAEHYGIYRDLFNGATFIPSSNATIAFDYDDEYVTPVHRGNIILPSEVCICIFIALCNLQFFNLFLYFMSHFNQWQRVSSYEWYLIILGSHTTIC